MSVATLIGAL